MATNAKKTAAHNRGQRGEDIAAGWYQAQGYTILARNWSCFEGELDIVAQRGRTVVICEVKARASDRVFDPALAISPSKQSKVRTAAFRWLDAHPRQARVRFDVALVVGERLSVIQGAF